MKRRLMIGFRRGGSLHMHLLFIGECLRRRPAQFDFVVDLLNQRSLLYQHFSFSTNRRYAI
jgi:hypothetical protein